MTTSREHNLRLTSRSGLRAPLRTSSIWLTRGTQFTGSRRCIRVCFNPKSVHFLFTSPEGLSCYVKRFEISPPTHFYMLSTFPTSRKPRHVPSSQDSEPIRGGTRATGANVGEPETFFSLMMECPSVPWWLCRRYIARPLPAPRCLAGAKLRGSARSAALRSPSQASGNASGSALRLGPGGSLYGPLS